MLIVRWTHSVATLEMESMIWFTELTARSRCSVTRGRSGSFVRRSGELPGRLLWEVRECWRCIIRWEIVLKK